MKKYSTTLLIVLLLLLSSALYLLQLTWFHAPRDTFFYLLQDFAFLPVQVALVSIALSRIISVREKRERLQKTHIMISAFFSEIGTELMNRLVLCGNIVNELDPHLNIEARWSQKEFREAASFVKNKTLPVSCSAENLEDIKALLIEKRMYILVMLGNPTLLEHEAFTDMLWAILHLTDELLARNSLIDLLDTDVAHLNNDVRRALSAIIVHWIGYMNYIKSEYPFLFSLETRRNPLNRYSEIVVRQG